jgi:predicted nucleic acid-binding protein
MSKVQVVIDTNVFIDVFVRKEDWVSRGSIELLKQIDEGKFEAVIPAPVLIEIFYIVLDRTFSEDKARKVLRTIMNADNTVCYPVGIEHALQAIEFYRNYNYVPNKGPGSGLGKRMEGLSLVDCLVLAVGKGIPGAVVCSDENKFAHVQGVRVKKPWEIVRFPERMEMVANP